MTSESLQSLTVEMKLRGNIELAHQLQTVCLWIVSRILHHITVGHPLSENVEALWVCKNGNPQERQDVWMGQVFPTDDLST